MNLVTAADKATPAEAAWWYWREGLSVIPCRGKKPNTAWQKYQQQRAHKPELLAWISDGAFQTIGIICGAVSGNLVVMDLDSESAVSRYELMFPNLLNTYAVKSGSGKGMHYYYQCDALPQTTRVALAGGHHGIELRANGCYVIAPPSIHPDSGMPYVAANSNPVMRLPHMEFVRQWIHGMIRDKYQSPDAPPPPRPLPVLRPKQWTTREAYMRDAYLRSAMNKQVDRITSASVGTRNTALYMSAQCLGQLIGGGELERATIESMLMNAAITVGLPEIESQKTIASGIDDGMTKPRVVPPAPQKKA